jgi:putative ABC transport system permease protein
MLLPRDILQQSLDALSAHKLRAALTTLGLMMGVATLITVMTIVAGANLFVEQKIANLGTNVFQIAKTPFANVDWDVLIRSQKFRRIEYGDLVYLRERCQLCEEAGGSASVTTKARLGNKEIFDVNLIGHTANMGGIDTRTLIRGRYFSPSEDDHASRICLIGDNLRKEFFEGVDPIGRTIRLGSEDFVIAGLFEPIGSVLGQNQDNFAIIPMTTYRKLRGGRATLILNVRAVGEEFFRAAIDEATAWMRARRHVPAGSADDFFIGTKDSYIQLWQSISGAFFAVFVLVSAISAVVGGIVIMNVMLVSVTERTKEIGIRRAVGATQGDIRRQFLVESVLQCLVGGAFGIGAGFLFAMLLRTFTEFPASVQPWVAVLGLVLSSSIGLFFGIYPAVRASRLDPVEALRAE